MTAFGRNLLLSLSARTALHEWLPSPTRSVVSQQHVPSSLERFVSTLERAGISRVAFLRHGNAPSLSLDCIDLDRTLSQTGKEQAIASGKSFGKQDLLPFYSTVLASPSPRTLDTARLFLEAAGSGAAENNTKVLAEPVLYDGTMQPGGSALFKKIGYAALRDYLDNPNNENDRNLARSLIGGYAHDVIQIMMKVVEEETAPTSQLLDSTTTASSGDTTLLMVGHALYLPAVALGVASLVGCRLEDQDLILNDMTKEAEGYLVDLSSSSASVLSRPH
mmetsp:Transcript_8274/g.13694  ORF Transcript_8274/g.13694 Transcript_8274/m.13694 type:complete len:277 (+) Transcript_8274:95-925(+)